MSVRAIVAAAILFVMRQTAESHTDKLSIASSAFAVLSGPGDRWDSSSETATLTSSGGVAIIEFDLERVMRPHDSPDHVVEVVSSILELHVLEAASLRLVSFAQPGAQWPAAGSSDLPALRRESLRVVAERSDASQGSPALRPAGLGADLEADVEAAQVVAARGSIKLDVSASVRHLVRTNSSRAAWQLQAKSSHGEGAVVVTLASARHPGLDLRPVLRTEIEHWPLALHHLRDVADERELAAALAADAERRALGHHVHAPNASSGTVIKHPPKVVRAAQLLAGEAPGQGAREHGADQEPLKLVHTGRAVPAPRLFASPGLWVLALGSMAGVLALAGGALFLIARHKPHLLRVLLRPEHEHAE